MLASKRFGICSFAVFVSLILLVGCKDVEVVADTDPDQADPDAGVVPEEQPKGPIVSLSVTQSNIPEGSAARFVVALDKAASESITVMFEYGGTAEEGSDYSSVSSTVIDVGNTSKEVVLETQDDLFYDGTENIELTIASVTGADSIISSSKSVASVTIDDAQSPPMVEISVDQFQVSEQGSVKIRLGSVPLAHDQIDVDLSLAVTDSRGLKYSSIRATRIKGGGFNTTTLFSPADYNLKKGAKIIVSIASVSGADAFIGPASSLEILVADPVVNTKTVQDPLKISKGGPWGIAPSHTSSRNLWWLETIRESGINWIRGFDQSHQNADSRLIQIVGADYYQSGVLQWSAGDGFPDEDIPGWTNRIQELLNDSAGRVQVWEVWNEPPNFSDDKDPAHYADIVRSAYDTVKNYDPNMAVGLTASSVNLNFMDQALVAGAKNHFDFIALHPYETIDLASTNGFEAQFMAIVPTVRKMLRAHNPEKENVPIIFTELGKPLASSEEKLSDLSVEEIAAKEKDQAITVVKAYVLSFAQGVSRVHWFQVEDDENMKFGFLSGDLHDFRKRPSYIATQTLIQQLGQEPDYIGWLLLDNQHYGFVFQSDEGPLLVTWSQPQYSTLYNFNQKIEAINPLTNIKTIAKTHTLSEVPLIIKGISSTMIDTAKANLSQPFPWDGDYSQAIEITASASGEAGLHYVGTPVEANVEGETVWDFSQSTGNRFTVDPNFMSYDSHPIRITALVRFKGDVNDTSIATPGFNLKYEQIDSVGYPMHSMGWRSVPKDNAWHEISWDIDDAQFVGLWSYHFSLDSDTTLNSQYYLKSVKVQKL